MTPPETPRDPITVLIVDDHAVVRRGVRAFLETQDDLEVLGEAESGEQALALAAEHAPDVVLIDLVMPGMDGVETTRQLKHASPASQIIVLTSYHQDEHILPALRAGALSYLLKDISPGELAAAVRQAMRREAVLHPEVAARVVRELQGSRGEPPNAFVELTDRELEVLRLIAGGQDNRTIAETLTISQKTVKRHVSNILSKLQLADRTQAAVYAWREGVVRRDAV